VAFNSARASRISFVALGVAVGLSALEAVGVAVNNEKFGGPQDWRVFADAGARAGTPALLHPHEPTDIFVYPSGFAWAYAPFAHLPYHVSFAIDVLIMLACAVAAAFIAARLYDFATPLALALTFGWTPVLNAVAVGQNATLGLLLALLTVSGFVRGATLGTALPLGLLLYKPTYALPLLALLVVRPRPRALAVVALCGALWYVAGVAATAGDWHWPAEWLALLVRYSGADFAFNAVKATSVPALLLRASAPLWSIALVVAAMLAAVLCALRRVDALEAGSAACIAGVALSPHAWPYDAALAFPMIALAWVRLPRQPRTVAVIIFALAGPAVLFSALWGFNPEAVVVVGGTIAWLIVRLRWHAASFAAVQTQPPQ
jgi:hypothetical protein